MSSGLPSSIEMPLCCSLADKINASAASCQSLPLICIYTKMGKCVVIRGDFNKLSLESASLGEAVFRDLMSLFKVSYSGFNGRIFTIYNTIHLHSVKMRKISVGGPFQ